MNLSKFVIPPWLQLAWKLLPWAIIAALAFVITLDRADIARKDARIQHYGDVMALTKERIEHAQAAAEAADQKHARDVETAQAKASQETENALIPAIDAARADALRYAAKLRAATAQGSVGQPHLPYATDATTGADAAGDQTELDVLRCADAVIKAEGWQAFWNKAFPKDPR